MAEPRAPQTEADGRTEEERRLAAIDWEGIERSPEFQELVRRRRAFVLPATIFFLAYYMGFIALTAYAQDFMAESVYQGLTVGYCLALTQFLMVLVLGIWYLRKSDREYDPLAERVVEMAEQTDGRRDGGRFERQAGTRAGATGREATR